MSPVKASWFYTCFCRYWRSAACWYLTQGTNWFSFSPFCNRKIIKTIIYRLSFMERMDQKLELVLQNLLIELMPCKRSLRNGANLSQSVLNKIHYNSSYGMCEYERSTDLYFEAKQIYFPHEFHRIIWRINVLLQIIKYDINIHEKLGSASPDNPDPDNWGLTVHESM